VETRESPLFQLEHEQAHVLGLDVGGLHHALALQEGDEAAELSLVVGERSFTPSLTAASQ